MIKEEFTLKSAYDGLDISCVTVDDKFYSVSPETVKDFFETEIKAKVE